LQLILPDSVETLLVPRIGILVEKGFAQAVSSDMRRTTWRQSFHKQINVKNQCLSPARRPSPQADNNQLINPLPYGSDLTTFS
jgi:hypothetical protein